jgi:hypothetical protein
MSASGDEPLVTRTPGVYRGLWSDCMCSLIGRVL